MDPTAEDPVELSGNCKETDALSQESDDFLRDLSETCGSRTAAAPEPQLCASDSRGAHSRHEPIQNQVMTPSRPTVMSSACSNVPGTVFDQNPATLSVKALDMPPGELSETSSKDQKVTSFDQRKSTAASRMAGVTDCPKTSLTEWQKTIVIANNMTNSKEDSQMQTFSDEQVVCGGQMTFNGNQTLYGGGLTFCGDQTHFGGRMTFGGDHTHYGGQMTALQEGCTVNFIGDQTFTGGHMTTYNHYQTFYWGQMVTLNGNQMRAVTDDHTLYGRYMMPCQWSSLPDPEFLNSSSFHLTQGQSLEKQKSKFKTQRCQFQKNVGILKPYACTYQGCDKSYSKRAHLQIHERKHTGEKPYKCNVKGCTWEFARSDELSRHTKGHTGERPYVCTLCNKDFSRSDHLKQHQKVHR